MCTNPTKHAQMQASMMKNAPHGINYEGPRRHTVVHAHVYTACVMGNFSA